MINIVRFNMQHLEDFKPFQTYYEGNLYDISNSCIYDPRFLGMSLIDGEDRVIALIGFNEIRGGTYELWCLPSYDFLQDTISFIKNVKIALESFIESKREEGGKIHRLEISIDKTRFKKGGRWAMFLGFKYEHTCRNYLPGRDHDIYVRFIWPLEQ